MGSTSKYGRATINPTAPSAVGTCDRCGFLYNLHVLRWQFQWAGTGMINKQLRVCPTCYDKPSEFLRTIILPADPPPVNQPRPEPYLVDEVNEYWLRAAGLGVPMFGAASDVQALIDAFKGLAPLFAADGNVAVETVLGRGLSAALDGASDLAATPFLGIGITAALSDVSDLAATLDLSAGSASRTVTDSFEINTTDDFTETGASIGDASADRLVVVCAAAINTTSNDGFDSVTIGGVAATLAVEIIRTVAGVGVSFCSIYWANVPTGTTANIDFVFTGDAVVADVEVYRVIGADTVTPISDTGTGSVASGNISDTVTIGNGSVTFAVVQPGINTTTAGTTVWTNATEDRDGGVDIGGIFVNSSFASRQDAVGPGATLITAAVTGEDVITDKTLAIAVFEP